MRLSLGLYPMAVVLCFIQPAAANVYSIIVHGKVTMEDGSPPPFTAGVERVCSDISGTAPGPTTNKKGEYTWRMDVDPLTPRACNLRATHPGYRSTSIDVSALDSTKTTIEVPPVVLIPNGGTAGGDPSAINISDSDVPGKAKSALAAAFKALDKSDYKEAASQLDAGVKAAPKWAQGWHALGVVYQRMDKQAEARDAYEHAIAADPKLLTAYVMLARVCIKTKDWQCAANTSDSLLKVDKKQVYPEIYLHQAVARYQLKDLPGAETSIGEAIRLDPNHKRPREEYVFGRILEAKGDANGAREHMTKYLELDRAPADRDMVKDHIENLGKPSTGVEPQLEGQ
jgi:Tfp pilus assembly protein PilF